MLRNFFAREDLSRQMAGQTLVEYALIIALVAMIIVPTLMLMADPVTGLFGAVLEGLNSVLGG